MKKNRNRNDYVRAKVQLQLTPGEMLKTIRELQGLSQMELASLCEIPQSNISALETGNRQIGRDRAITLARALKVHPAVILFPEFSMSEVA